MTLKKLLKTMFAVKVKAAIDRKELTWRNHEEWIIAYNDGMRDERLLKEVEALLRYYKEA